MIEIKNLSKKFNDEYVLKDINISLPRFGLVAFYGQSGSGKSTLLNCLSGLLDFEGSINVDGIHLENLTQIEKDQFRLSNLGFVFQDFKLYDNDTVLDNVIFPLELISNSNKNINILKVKDTLETVGLKNLSNQKAKYLSGGEKQRVAIARAIINSPKIVLADEPTGALDNKNAVEIMNILSKISKQSLVIVVSHDRELTKKYADIILDLKDGVIEEKMQLNLEKHEEHLPINKGEDKYKKSNIPFSFLLRHTFSAIKEKKFRSLVTTIITSLGLIGVGLAFTLSSALSTNIKSVYATLANEDQIILKNKEEKGTSSNRYFASFEQTIDLANKHPSLVNDIGVCYYNDFENFFPNVNALFLQQNNRIIEGLNARHINEFLWLDNHHETFYPNRPNFLDDDEIVLSLTIDMIEDLCFSLNIVRTITSLSNYLLENSLYVYFRFANVNWQYDDEQLLEIKAFSLNSFAGIYHYNHLWNEVMFEDNMRFPTIDNMLNLKHPWDLKKVIYIDTNNLEKLLKYGRFNSDFSSFCLEIADNKYYPLLLKNMKDRILVFANSQPIINSQIKEHLLLVNKSINNVIYGSNGGYAIFPEQLMMGFARQTFFANSLEKCEETIDIITNNQFKDNETYHLPTGVFEGHYSKSLSKGVSFKPINNQKINGKMPKDTSEIIISSSLKKDLEISGDKIYVSAVTSERLQPDGKIVKKFNTIELLIVGEIVSEERTIFHDEYWSLLFFQIQLGISVFDLDINTVSFALDGDIESNVKQYKKAFPNYDFMHPLDDINKSVEETCFYIEIALFSFSFIASIIAVILILLTNYLYVVENKKDIALARCVGVSLKESRKFSFFYSIMMCIGAFVVSVFEILILSVVIALIISNSLASSFSFVINPISIPIMLGVCLILSFISALFASKTSNRISPLELFH